MRVYLRVVDMKQYSDGKEHLWLPRVRSRWMTIIEYSGLWNVRRTPVSCCVSAGAPVEIWAQIGRRISEIR
jgi:hypothetical protein